MYTVCMLQPKLNCFMCACSLGEVECCGHDQVRVRLLFFYSHMYTVCMLQPNLNCFMCVCSLGEVECCGHDHLEKLYLDEVFNISVDKLFKNLFSDSDFFRHFVLSRKTFGIDFQWAFVALLCNICYCCVSHTSP